MVKVLGKLDSWADGDAGNSDFMRLEEGSNLVRCMSSPYQCYIHWANDVSGKQQKFNCAMKDCPACQQGVKSQPHWFLAVLNRKTNKPAVLEIGPQIFKQIKVLSMKEKWGDPRAYDVDIEKQPKGSQPLYVVSPEPKEELTSAEKAAVKTFLEKVDLNKMTVAPSPDEVREKLGMAPVSVASDKTADDTGDDDFDFGDN